MEVELQVQGNEIKRLKAVLRPDEEFVDIIFSDNPGQTYSIDLENLYRALKAFRAIYKLEQKQHG